MAKPTFPKLIARMVKEEGVFSVYAGLSAALMRQALYGTARIGLHRKFSNMLYVAPRCFEGVLCVPRNALTDDRIAVWFTWMRNSVERNKGNVPFWQKSVASMSAGAIAVVIGTPFDVALVRMQADTMRPVEQRRNYKNVFDACARVMREEGLSRLYAGLTPNVLRGMSMNVGMMACYDQAKEVIMKLTGDPDPKNPNLTTKLGSSAIAGFTAAFFSLPFDLLKSRLQDMRKTKTGEAPYKGVVDAAYKIFRTEGPLAFWTGFGAYYGRCAPHAMIILMTIESITQMYRKAFNL